MQILAEATADVDCAISSVNVNANAVCAVIMWKMRYATHNSDDFQRFRGRIACANVIYALHNASKYAKGQMKTNE